MSTHTIPSYFQNKYLAKGLLAGIIFWMSVYPVYNNYYKGLAIEQYSRFIDFKAGKSMFFNPWQYRVLCPMLIEGTYQVLDHTLFKLIPFGPAKLNLPGDTDSKSEAVQKILVLSQNPEFIKYTIVFVGFRIVQHMLIFWLVWQYFSIFVRNKQLVIFSLMLVPLLLGNGVMDSDLAFNSYMDLILYLCAGLVIIKGYSGWWIVPISILGAFNRETSVLIPVLYFCTKIDWTTWPKLWKLIFGKPEAFWITSISLLTFSVIFVSIRMYYGYQPPTLWRVPAGLPMLKLNLLSPVGIKTYNEMYGMFGFLPIWCILIFKQLNPTLKIFFFVIVPVWFGIHLFSVVAYQSRLFMVPTLLIFMPAILSYIDSQFVERPAQPA